MNTVIVPINAIESAGRLIQAAGMVARSIPAGVDIVLDRQVRNLGLSGQIQASIPNGVHATISTAKGGQACLPTGVRCAGKGRSILIVDAEAPAPDALNPAVAEWQGPIVFVPESVDKPVPETPAQVLVALTSPDDEADRRTIPFATRLALCSGAALAVTVVIDLECVESLANTSGRDSSNGRFSDYYIAQRYLSEVAGRLRDRRIRTTWEIRTGPPAGELVRLAETTTPDLIVASASLQSVVQQVARSAGTPVLLCRGGRSNSG